MTLLRSDLQLSAPDDVYEAIISLGNGFDERTAHTALAAFALLIANQIGDGKSSTRRLLRSGKRSRSIRKRPSLGCTIPIASNSRSGARLLRCAKSSR